MPPVTSCHTLGKVYLEETWTRGGGIMTLGFFSVEDGPRSSA